VGSKKGKKEQKKQEEGIQETGDRRQNKNLPTPF
jgi:hypothetical protein